MDNKSNNFDRIAFAYDFLAGLIFGNALRKAQTLYLNRIPENSKVLILGGGTGWLLKELLLQNSSLRIDYVEISSKMIDNAKKLLTREELSQVNFIYGDENCLKTKDSYNVVITYFILDLFKSPRLNIIFKKLDKALKPDGLWLFADFYPRENNPWWQKVLILSMYRFFTWVSNVEGDALPNFNHLFLKNSFIEIASQNFYAGFIGAKVYEKSTNSADPKGPKGLSGF